MKQWNKIIFIFFLSTGLILSAMGRDRGGYGRGFGGDFMGGPQRGMLSMNQLDLNKDGQISREEVDERFNKIFASIDGDSDEKISKEEFIAESHRKMALMSQLTHSDVTPEMKEEADKRAVDHFGNLDDDDNGYLDSSEFLFNKNKIDRIFNKLDKDENGMLSESEMKKFHKKWNRRGRGKGPRSGDHNDEY